QGCCIPFTKSLLYEPDILNRAHVFCSSPMLRTRDEESAPRSSGPPILQVLLNSPMCSGADPSAHGNCVETLCSSRGSPQDSASRGYGSLTATGVGIQQLRACFKVVLRLV